MTESNNDPFFIPSTYSRIIARELGLQERDLERLLEGTGLSRSIMLPGDETHLTGRQQVRVLQNARRMQDAPDFGLRLGRQLNPSAHGPLGYLALSSPDLLTALQALRDFLPARIPFLHLEVSLEEDWLRCGMSLKLEANADEQRVLQECFALGIQSFVESILGGKAKGSRFEMAHSLSLIHISEPTRLWSGSRMPSSA